MNSPSLSKPLSFLDGMAFNALSCNKKLNPKCKSDADLDQFFNSFTIDTNIIHETVDMSKFDTRPVKIKHKQLANMQI